MTCECGHSRRSHEPHCTNEGCRCTRFREETTSTSEDVIGASVPNYYTKPSIDIPSTPDPSPTPDPDFSFGGGDSGGGGASGDF